MNEKSKVVGVKKNGKGDITDVKLGDGNIYPVNEAIQMVKSNLIEGLNVSTSKNGIEYLRSDPDRSTDNNLDNMPTF